jgi:hypothetical protein
MNIIDQNGAAVARGISAARREMQPELGSLRPVAAGNKQEKAAPA